MLYATGEQENKEVVGTDVNNEGREGGRERETERGKDAET